MRIVCPNCRAEYEIPDEAIPPAGRDVQCSTCAHAWYQLPAAAAHAEAPNPATQDAGPTPPPDTEMRPERPNTRNQDVLRAALDTRRARPQSSAAADNAELPPPPSERLDPAMLHMLREEAAREARARHFGDDELLATQPDLGLEPPGQVPAATVQTEVAASETDGSMRDRLARLQAAERDEDPTDWVEAETEPAAAPGTATVPLRPAADPGIPARAAAGAVRLPVRLGPAELARIEEQRQRRGFRLGFSLPVALCGLVILAYVAAPWLTDRVPAAAPALDAISESGEAARSGLADSLRHAIDRLTGASADS